MTGEKCGLTSCLRHSSGAESSKFRWALITHVRPGSGVGSGSRPGLGSGSCPRLRPTVPGPVHGFGAKRTPTTSRPSPSARAFRNRMGERPCSILSHRDRSGRRAVLWGNAGALNPESLEIIDSLRWSVAEPPGFRRLDKDQPINQGINQGTLVFSWERSTATPLSSATRARIAL